MTALFIVLGALVVIGTALALAGRWHPEGLDCAPPPRTEGGLQQGGETRFDVVVRGYRMDQVDAELARLRGMLAGQPLTGNPGDGPQGMRPHGDGTTIEA